MAHSESPDAPGMLDGERPALIPTGKYTLCFEYHETKFIFSRPKLFLWFKVLDYGDHFGTKLARDYGARRLIGRSGKHARFAVGWKSDFLREYAALFGAPHRLDRIAMTPFERVTLQGKVRTVEKGHAQRVIAQGLRYSVIEELLRVEDGCAFSSASPPASASAPAPPTSKPPKGTASAL